MAVLAYLPFWHLRLTFLVGLITYNWRPSVADKTKLCTRRREMLNELVVEGIVMGTWRYGDTRFVRIACYPDPGRNHKGNGDGGNGHDEADFITLRFEQPLAMAAAHLQKRSRIRATGFLASRDYDIPLARFADVARGDEGAVQALRKVAHEHGQVVHKPHVLNEIVVETFVAP